MSTSHARPRSRRSAPLLVLLALALVSAVAPAAASDYQIVNGQPAADGAYPWMAAFIQDGGQACGASVVDETWILTAAHCVIDERGLPSTTADQLEFYVDTTDLNAPGQVLTAAEIIAHPNYDPITTNNDIALVRVNEAAAVTPVQLPTPEDAALEQPPTVSRVIGYGSIRTDGPSSDRLLQVDVDVNDFDSCNAAYGFELDPRRVQPSDLRQRRRAGRAGDRRELPGCPGRFGAGLLPRSAAVRRRRRAAGR